MGQKATIFVYADHPDSIEQIMDNLRALPEVTAIQKVDRMLPHDIVAQVQTNDNHPCSVDTFISTAIKTIAGIKRVEAYSPH